MLPFVSFYWELEFVLLYTSKIPHNIIAELTLNQ